jgi:hypothetical protein
MICCRHGVHQARSFIPTTSRGLPFHARGKVTRGHALKHLNGPLQRAHHRAAQHTTRQHRQHQRCSQQATRNPDAHGIARLRIVKARLAVLEACSNQRPQRRVVIDKQLGHLGRVQFAIGGEIAAFQRGNGRLQRRLHELGACCVGELQLGAVGVGNRQLHELGPRVVGRVDHGVRIGQQLLQFVRRRHRIKIGQVNACPQQIDGVLGQQVQPLGIFQVHGTQVVIRRPAGGDARKTHDRDHHGKRRNQHRQSRPNARVHPLPHMYSPAWLAVRRCLVLFFPASMYRLSGTRFTPEMS